MIMPFTVILKNSMKYGQNTLSLKNVLPSDITRSDGLAGRPGGSCFPAESCKGLQNREKSTRADEKTLNL